MVELHGVKFYGVLNDEQIKILEQVELITNREEWEGLKGIYCFNDGTFSVDDNIFNGLYVSSRGLGDAKMEFEISNEHYSLIDFPVIAMATEEELAEPYQFAFILLHELGHHVDAKKRPDRVRDKETDEIIAHKFAIEKYFKLDTGRTVVKDMPYLKEACEQFEYELIN